MVSVVVVPVARRDIKIGNGPHAYLIDAGDIRTQASVHAEHAAIDDSGESEIIKDLTAITPHVGRAVLALALVEETVHLSDLPRLVVAPDERDAVRVPHFEGEEEEKGLDAVEPPIDEIA